jgi:hypothetical protein
MALWLQIILTAVLVVVGGCLVALLLQLRRTATAMERLAESAREDIHLIAGDVHKISVQTDALAEKMNTVLELPTTLGRMTTGVLLNLEAATEKGIPSWLSILLTGLKFTINLLRRKPDPA